MTTQTSQQRYLGPALVTAVDDDAIQALVGDDVIAVTMAMPMAYAPATGDVLLVIHDGGPAYAIGVIQGTGTTTLRSPGDLTLQAPAGRVRVDAGQGIDLEAPETRVRGDRFDVLVDGIVQRARTCLHTIGEWFRLKAGRQQTQIDGASVTEVGEHHVRAKGPVIIDGTTIHLG